MDDDALIPTATAEARLIGVDRSSVSRARKHPTHPVNLPDAVKAGDQVLVRASAVRAFWVARWAGASADDLARKRRRPAPALKIP